MVLDLEKFKFGDGKTDLSAAELNPRFFAIVRRLHALELLSIDWTATISQVQNHGLARINDAVQPLIDSLKIDLTGLIAQGQADLSSQSEAVDAKLGEVDGKLAEVDAVMADISAIVAALVDHVARRDNPHGVTAAQALDSLGQAAKGDLLAFSGPGTPTRLPVGLAGQALLAAPGGVPGVAWGDTLRSTDITNAEFGVWSNATIESAVSSVNLIANGEFETDTSGWSAGNSATLARDTSTFQNGMACLKITNNGATNGNATKAITTVVGRVYKLVCYAKCGTAALVFLGAGTTTASFNTGNSDLGYVSTASNSAFVRLELIFEAAGTTTYVGVYNQNPSGVTGYYDSITLYDMGANLVTNGTFNTNTTGWTAQNTPTTFASVAGGLNGSCLQITNNGTNAGAGYANFTGLTVGKLYRLTGWAKTAGAAANVCVGSTGVFNAQDYGTWTTTAGTFVNTSILFEATTTDCTITLRNATNSGGTAYYDSITLTEVTVGCVDYNTKALDLWDKDLVTKCWRETTRTKGGSPCALRVYGGKVYWSDGQRKAKPEFYSRYADVGAVVKGLWVLSSVAAHARVGIVDSTGESWSDYHPGDGQYHYLQVTRSPAAGITSFQTVVDSGAGAEAIFSQPQAQRGTRLGATDFVHKENETILFNGLYSSNYGSWSVARSTQPTKAVNVHVDTKGAVPKGAKAVLVGLFFSDTAIYQAAVVNGSGDEHLAISNIVDRSLYCFTQVNGGSVNTCVGEVRINNGNIYVGFNASGSGTASVLIEYLGVIL